VEQIGSTPSRGLLLGNYRAPAAKKAMRDEIEERRMEIDRIDDELLRLLNERARLVGELGVIKKRRGMQVRDRNREDVILTRVREENRGPLDDASALRIFQFIIAESRRFQTATSDIDSGPAVAKQTSNKGRTSVRNEV
jgi:chorismate mutase